MLAALALLLVLSPTDSLDVRRSDLLDAVRHYVQPLDAAWDEVSTQVEWVDLNSDGREDALVALEGGAWCGPDGCTILVFENMTGADAQEVGPFRPAAEIGGAHLPFHVVPGASLWSDLVIEGHDGVLRRLSFDGETYPFHSDGAPAFADGLPPGIGLFSGTD